MIVLRNTVAIPGYHDHRPVRPLRDALAAIATWPDQETRYADLEVAPVWDEDARATRWYTLSWAHRTVVAVPGGTDEPTNYAIEHVAIEHIQDLPAPPVRSREDRIARYREKHPINDEDLDNWSELQLAFYGGREGTLRTLRWQRDLDAENDRSIDMWDWDRYAEETLLPALDLATRRLTSGQRAAVAAARLLEADRALAAARASLRAHLINAAKDGDTGPLAHIAPYITELDPTLPEHPLARAGSSVHPDASAAA
ncbi:hypothetical protein [Streptomyces sp. SM12]|uniref:hypothetical protein n=1 Tax=Streptomyces sp. SM12 TaxID=1071602 RepID=UPI000CD5296D|nr:hypothetical protein [Streptomyces sp. SM12]